MFPEDEAGCSCGFVAYLHRLAHAVLLAIVFRNLVDPLVEAFGLG